MMLCSLCCLRRCNYIIAKIKIYCWSLFFLFQQYLSISMPMLSSSLNGIWKFGTKFSLKKLAHKNILRYLYFDKQCKIIFHNLTYGLFCISSYIALQTTYYFQNIFFFLQRGCTCKNNTLICFTVNKAPNH